MLFAHPLRPPRRLHAPGVSRVSGPPARCFPCRSSAASLELWAQSDEERWPVRAFSADGPVDGRP
jgi:hypothetical protein